MIFKGFETTCLGYLHSRKLCTAGFELSIVIAGVFRYAHEHSVILRFKCFYRTFNVRVVVLACLIRCPISSLAFSMFCVEHAMNLVRTME